MRLILAVIASLPFAGLASAADPPVPGFLIFERSTPLHKVLAGRDDGVYVAVNSRVILDEEALAKQLKAHTEEGPRIVFHLVKEGTQDEETIERLHDRLENLARKCGFADPRRTTTYTGSFDWAKATAAARQAIAEGRTGDETGRGDGGVRVYPIRTPLSVHLSKDSQVIADISPEAMSDLIELERRIRSLMKDQQIEPKGRIRFITRYRGDESPIPDSHYERMKTLGKALGFDESTTTTSYE